MQATSRIHKGGGVRYNAEMKILAQDKLPSVCQSCFHFFRNFASQIGSPARKLSQDAQIIDAAGLSTAVVANVAGEVGPGASKDGPYKNPEYFLFNVTSFYEAEVEMAKYRLPQPSNKK